MIKNVLSEIGGVGVYGAISITLFFTVFTTALVRACLLSKSFAHRMGELPLHDSQPADTITATVSQASAPSIGNSRHE